MYSSDFRVAKFRSYALWCDEIGHVIICHVVGETADGRKVYASDFIPGLTFFRVRVQRGYEFVIATVDMWA